MNLLAFPLLVLAGWRLSHLITREDGPGRIFRRARQLAGAEREGELSSLAYGITCMWCVSVWAGLVLFALWRALPRASLYVIWPLALSAAAVLLEAFRPSEATDF